MNVVPLVGKRERLAPANSYIYFPVVERPLFWKSKSNTYLKSPDHKQLLRADEGNPIPLAVVGMNYKTVQNRELFEAVESNIIDTLPPEKLGNVTVKDRMSYDGAMCLREYVFNDITADVPTTRHSTSDRDGVAFRAIVQNGFGNSAVKIIIGAIDFFCMNGMIIGIADKKVRRHTSGLDVTALSGYITGNLKLFEESAKMWCEWCKRDLPDETVSTFFEGLVRNDYLSERLSRALFTRYLREKSDRGSTLWALASALTFYASHDSEEDGFSTRTTTRDHVAATMMNREEQVRKIIRSEHFQTLAA